MNESALVNESPVDELQKHQKIVEAVHGLEQAVNELLDFRMKVVGEPVPLVKDKPVSDSPIGSGTSLGGLLSGLCVENIHLQRDRIRGEIMELEKVLYG